MTEALVTLCIVRFDIVQCCLATSAQLVVTVMGKGHGMNQSVPCHKHVSTVAAIDFQSKQGHSVKAKKAVSRSQTLT